MGRVDEIRKALSVSLIVSAPTVTEALGMIPPLRADLRYLSERLKTAEADANRIGKANDDLCDKVYGLEREVAEKQGLISNLTVKIRQASAFLRGTCGIDDAPDGSQIVQTAEEVARMYHRQNAQAQALRAENKRLRGDVKALRDEITRPKALTEPVACAERLPEEGRVVMAYTRESQTWWRAWRSAGHWWISDSTRHFDGLVTHWQPLPADPEATP